MTELTQRLRQASTGDASAIILILNDFAAGIISTTEAEQIHIYLKKASEESHHAIYLHGLLYDRGFGVQASADMAFLLMWEAAAKGNANATYEVGHRFLIGAGVEKNAASALRWLNLAAKSPHYIAAAMYDLGQIYEQGLGVDIDSVIATTWYNKAAERGYAQASVILKKGV